MLNYSPILIIFCAVVVFSIIAISIGVIIEIKKTRELKNGHHFTQWKYITWSQVDAGDPVIIELKCPICEKRLYVDEMIYDKYNKNKMTNKQFKERILHNKLKKRK